MTYFRVRNRYTDFLITERDRKSTTLVIAGISFVDAIALHTCDNQQVREDGDKHIVHLLNLSHTIIKLYALDDFFTFITPKLNSFIAVIRVITGGYK